MKVHFEFNVNEVTAIDRICTKLSKDPIGKISTRKDVTKAATTETTVLENGGVNLDMNINLGFSLEVLKVIEEASDLIMSFAQSVKFMCKSWKDRFAPWRTEAYEIMAQKYFDEEEHKDDFLMIVGYNNCWTQHTIGKEMTVSEIIAFVNENTPDATAQVLYAYKSYAGTICFCDLSVILMNAYKSEIPVQE